MDSGTQVKIVVPFGPNAGQITRYGTIVGRKYSGIDGRTYYVREKDGTVTEHADSWVKPIR